MKHYLTKTAETASSNELEAVKSLILQGMDKLGLKPDPILDGDLRNLQETYRPPNSMILILDPQTNIIVGCGAIRTHTNQSGEMRRIYIQESHQNRGIGTQIIRELIHQASTLGLKQLWTRTTTKSKGTELYKKLGFKIRPCTDPKERAGTVELIITPKPILKTTR
jgi:putative acetyltransferase